MSEATTDSLLSASSSSFSTRFFSQVWPDTNPTRYRVRSRSRLIRIGGMKEGRNIWRSATLHNQTASSRSVLGRPGRFLTSLALTSQRLEPMRLHQVKRLPPVTTSPFHHDPGHPRVPQPLSHDLQRAVDRAEGRDLLDPPGAALGVGLGSGTRTQHTSSALPISKAATRAMISCSSCR